MSKREQSKDESKSDTLLTRLGKFITGSKSQKVTKLCRGASRDPTTGASRWWRGRSSLRSPALEENSEAAT